MRARTALATGLVEGNPGLGAYTWKWIVPSLASKANIALAQSTLEATCYPKLSVPDSFTEGFTWGSFLGSLGLLLKAFLLKTYISSTLFIWWSLFGFSSSVAPSFTSPSKSRTISRTSCSCLGLFSFSFFSSYPPCFLKSSMNLENNIGQDVVKRVLTIE